MAHTKISDLYPKAIITKKEKKWYFYGQFRTKGEAVDHCIRNNISLDKIVPVYNLFGKIDFYTIDREKPKLAKVIWKT